MRKQEHQAVLTSKSASKKTNSLMRFLVLLGLILCSAGGNAEAVEKYKVALSDDKSHMTVTADSIAIATKTFKLTAEQGYALPASLTVKLTRSGKDETLKPGEGYKYDVKNENVTINKTLQDKDKITITSVATLIERSVSFTAGSDSTSLQSLFGVTNVNITTEYIQLTGATSYSFPEEVTAFTIGGVNAMSKMTYDPWEGKITLKEGEKFTGDVVLTAKGVSIDDLKKLNTLTWSIDGSTPVSVTGFDPEEDDDQSYTVNLPATTAVNALVKIAATTKIASTKLHIDEGTASMDREFSVVLAGGGKVVKLKVSDKTNAERTITITFKTATSTDTSLKSLNYVLDDGTHAGTIPISNIAEDGTCTVALNDYIEKERKITLSPVANATGATIENNKAVALDKTSNIVTFTVKAADNTTTKPYTITFTSLNKVATVGTIADATFDNAYKTSAEVIAFLSKDGDYKEIGITTEKSSTTTKLPIVWTYNNADNDNKAYDPTSGKKHKFTWTLTIPSNLKEKAGLKKTDKVEFTNAAVSTDATLADNKIQYQYEGGEKEYLTIGSTAEVPYNISQVKLYVTPTHSHAVVVDSVKRIPGETPEQTKARLDTIKTRPAVIPITLKTGDEMTTSYKFQVVAENRSHCSPYEVTFNRAAEVITFVGEMPTTHKFTTEMHPGGSDAEKQIAAIKALDELTKNVVIRTNGSTKMKILWTVNVSYNAGSGKENTFTWTVVRADGKKPALKGATGVTITKKDVKVYNYNKAHTGSIGEHTSPATEDKIGDGSTTTTATSVTIESGADRPELTFNKVTVEGNVTVSDTVNKLDFLATTIKEQLILNAAAPSVLIKGSTIKDIVSNKTSVLYLGANTIDKITNSDTLTIKSVAQMPMTRANAGGIGKVVNSGTFTDESAMITEVYNGDKVELKITAQPITSYEILASGSVALTTNATSEIDGAKIKYQWEKKDANGEWYSVQAETEKTFNVNNSTGIGDYRCEISATNSGVTTTLHTNTSSITAKTTYTVTLPAVTGVEYSSNGTSYAPSMSESVAIGGNYSFKVRLLEGYDLSTIVVKVGSTVLTRDASGYYTTPAVNANITVSVYGVTKNPDNFTIKLTPKNGVQYIYSGSLSVAKGSSFSFRLILDEKNYTKTKDFGVYAGIIKLTPNSFGVYTFSDIKSNVIIKVTGFEKKENFTIELPVSKDDRFVFDKKESEYSVKYNSDFFFTITVDTWRVKEFKVYANDSLIKPYESEVKTKANEPRANVFTYRLTHIEKDMKISIKEITSTPTSVEDIAKETYVFGGDDIIYIHTAKEERVSIITLGGSLYKQIEVNGSEEVYVPAGIYIIHIGDSIVEKVMVK